MEQRRQIVLDAMRPPITIARDDVYFAFGSGRFTYDCVSCGAKCCHGHGYDTRTGPELQNQLSFKPSVRFFLDASRVGGTVNYYVKNCQPACFFLTESGLCDLHQRYGQAAKPETCRLFPFNSFRRVRDCLVVNTHPSLCPLRVCPDGVVDTKSDHDHLFAEMSKQPLGGAVPEAEALGIDHRLLIELERRILALSNAHLHDPCYEQFCAGQVSLTREIFPSHHAAQGAADRHGILQEIDAFTARVHNVLGVPDAVGHMSDPAVTRTLTAVTPSLRARLVFPRAESLRRFRREIALERVPYLLLVLRTFMNLARDAGMREITYQTVATTFDDCLLLLRLLAHLDIVMLWRSDEIVDLRWTGASRFSKPYLAVVKALLPAVQRQRGCSLWQVLCECLPQDTVDRVLFLRMLARQITNHLTPIEQPPHAPRRHRRVKSAVQHWALQHISIDMLQRFTASPDNRLKVSAAATGR